MADRQDIDALMVGALYGELTAAERTKLDAHLASHPEDRAAMQGLETARATVRRGMTELAPAEPPQAVSAILLQEAARRRGPAVTATEPAEREGMWERFVAWFRPLAGHPALAAAAALILVAGTATALWMRGEGKVAEPTTSTARNEQAAGVAPPSREAAMLDKAADDTAGASSGSAAGSSFEVGGVVADPAPALVAKVESPGDEADRSPTRGAGTGAASGKGGGSAPRHTAKPGTANGIVVDGRSDTPEVKDLEEEQLAQEAADGDDSVDGYRKATTSGATQPGAPDTAPMDPQLEEWAQGQHQKLVKLVKDGKCPEAGRVGADLKAKAPDYYAANVANDRDIRQCKSYIEKRAKKKAEKDYKSRSQGNSYDDADVEAN